MSKTVPLPRHLVTQIVPGRAAVGRGGCLLPQSFGHVVMVMSSWKAETIGAQLMLVE